jgi:DNA-binding CsgD family transcriptional regulator
LVLSGLAEVVGSASVTLTHLDLLDQHEVAVLWPPSRPDLDVLAQYPMLGRTHPLRRALLEAAGRRVQPAPLRVSDVLTAQAWRNSPIYQHTLRGVTDQMCLPVAFRGHQVQALTLNRTAGRFTDRQRALLAACGAHVRAALDRGLLTGGVGLQLSPRLEWVALERAPGLLERATGRGAQSAGTATGRRPARLSTREAEVLALVAQGFTDAQAASRLGVRPAMVSKHLHRIYHRHRLANRAAAARFLEQRGSSGPVSRPGSGRSGEPVPNRAGRVRP